MGRRRWIRYRFINEQQAGAAAAAAAAAKSLIGGPSQFVKQEEQGQVLEEWKERGERRKNGREIGMRKRLRAKRAIVLKSCFHSSQDVNSHLSIAAAPTASCVPGRANEFPRLLF